MHRDSSWSCGRKRGDMIFKQDKVSEKESIWWGWGREDGRLERQRTCWRRCYPGRETNHRGHSRALSELKIPLRTIVSQMLADMVRSGHLSMPPVINI